VKSAEKKSEIYQRSTPKQLPLGHRYILFVLRFAMDICSSCCSWENSACALPRRSYSCVHLSRSRVCSLLQIYTDANCQRCTKNAHLVQTQSKSRH